MHNVPPGERGFTVVEALVATAIVATMAAAFFQVVATNWRTASAVADRRLALLVAQSARDIAMAQGTGGRRLRQGASAGMTWTVTSEGASAGPGDAGIRTETLEVQVRSEASTQPLIVLRTLAIRP